MTTYAALTDGTTTVTFASPGTLGWYRIETGWAPKIAGLRQSALGGRGPYEDVTEEIPISVGGSTAAHMYSNLSTLKVLIDQANRWYLDENVSAVLFKYSPEGATVSSAASPLQAATWNASLEFPAGWPGIPQSGSAVWGSGLTMRFARKGLWGHTTVTSASAAQPVAGSGYSGSPIQYVFSGSTQYPSPVSWLYSSLTIYPTGSPATVFMIGEGTTSIYAIQGETAVSASSGSFARLADGNNYGGSVLRYTPSTTNAATTAIFAASMAGSPKRVGIILRYRNNGANTDFTAKVNIYTPGSAAVGSRAQIFSTPTVPLANSYDSLGGTGIMANVFMGLVTPPTAPRYMSLTLQASSAAETLDIDTIHMFDADKVHVFGINNNNNNSSTSGSIIDGTLTRPAPYINFWIDNAASLMSGAGVGDYYVSLSSASVSMVVLGQDAGGYTSGSLQRLTSYAIPC